MSERVALDRVEFVEPINVPAGYNKDGSVIYPTREKVLQSEIDPTNRLRSRVKYNLWLCLDTGYVIVQHPESGVTEEVPPHNVCQLRRTGVKANRIEPAPKTDTKKNEQHVR
jgi:hypothetical protein